MTGMRDLVQEWRKRGAGMSEREKLDLRARILAEARGMTRSEGMSAADKGIFDEAMDIVGVLNADVHPGRIVRPANGVVGMGAGDMQSYSILRAVRACVSGDWRGAEFEREASDAVASKVGRMPRSFFVPPDVLAAETRGLIKGTPAQGGYLVGTDLMGVSFIDQLHNKMVVVQAGATVMRDLVGDVAIPRQTGRATGYWLAENGAPTESQQALDQVAMSPKTVGAFTDISRKMLKQSSIDAELFVRNDLSTVIALAIDLASLHGTGSGNQPLGIAGQTGVNVVVIGADGGPITLAHIIDMATQVALDNADVGRLAYVTNPKVKGKLANTPKIAGYPVYVWGEEPRPLNSYPAYVTSQVRSDLTKGTGTALSAVFFGNWVDLIIAQWGILDVLVDPFTGSSTGAVRVTTFQDVDIGVRHPGSFAVILDAVTT